VIEAPDSTSRVVPLEGRATVHRSFGGGGVEGRRTPRDNAHDALMRCVDAEGNPAPKCFHQTADAEGIHSEDCNQATDLLVQLRAITA